MRTLNLPDDNVLTDRGLEALFTLQELIEITINCKRITDNGVLRLILACPKLQVLHLEYCSQLTDKLIYEIISKLKNNSDRPLPIKLFMPRTTAYKLTNVTDKDIIDVVKADGI